MAARRTTRLVQFFQATGEIELITDDPVVAAKAESAHLNQQHVKFQYLDGEREQWIAGLVQSIQKGPVRFVVYPVEPGFVVRTFTQYLGANTVAPKTYYVAEPDRGKAAIIVKEKLQLGNDEKVLVADFLPANTVKALALSPGEVRPV